MCGRYAITSAPEAIRALFRYPRVTSTMIECYFIEQSWDWQFRGDDPPMKLLRHTWKRNSIQETA